MMYAKFGADWRSFGGVVKKFIYRTHRSKVTTINTLPN